MIFDDIIKIFIPATLAFIVGIGIAPLLTHYLYRYKVWKKTSARVALDGTNAVEFEKLRTDVETKTPRMGGILIWASVFLVTLGIWFIDTFASFAFVEKLNFLSRSQTWIPLWTLLAGALIGFINDMYDIQPGGGQGIRLRTRLLCISVIALR
jgi:phospho-N-acetylmuramoyl-pentapeptide-transferase